MQKHITKAAAKRANAPLRAARTPQKVQRPDATPEKFTYALAQWTAERRTAGWFVARTVPSFAGNKPEWSGPFDTIETACLAIARRHATELADRHTRSVEMHKIGPASGLYGLKPTTRLR